MLAGCSVEKSFQVGEFDAVIQKLDKDPLKNSPAENYLLAESYRRSNRPHEAVPYYEEALTKNIDQQYPEAELFFARALRADQENVRAEQVLMAYLDKVDDEAVKARVASELENIRKIEEVKKQTSFYRINELKELNTPAAEYAPAYFNGMLYFTSNRQGGKTYRATGTPFTDLYQVPTKGAKVNVSRLNVLPPVINDPNVNEGTVAVSANGSVIIFAKGNTGRPSGKEQVNLFFSRYRNGQWSDPRPLNINDPRTWDSTPTLSQDGQTLYWSSTREGGYGGADLYTAKLNRRGLWVDIRNLGPEINTFGNEAFPHVAEDGTLYFSSDGHPGFGLLDIFSAKRESGTVKIENLGAPMNSKSDDFSFHAFDLTRGFFSSNRRGGTGDDDIYTYVNEDPDLKIVNYWLTGITVTTDDGGEEIVLPNTKVRLVDANELVVDEVFTSEDGRFRFRVFPEEKYYLIGEKTDYFTTRKVFSTIGETVDKTTLTAFVTNKDFETVIQMDRIVIEKPIVLENIYYDFDKWDIRKDAAEVLDSLVMVMNDNPDIFIELGSHTDSRGGEDYNLDLSRKRALSAVRYIIGRGIDDDRITARGYGETLLLVPRAETEDEHQINRRTEFKVLRYNPDDREESLPVNEEEQDEYDRFFIDVKENDEVIENE